MSQGTWVPKNRHKGQRYQPSRAESAAAVAMVGAVTTLGDLFGFWDLPPVWMVLVGLATMAAGWCAVRWSRASS